MHHPLAEVSSQFGASMGRPETHDSSFADQPVNFQLVKLAWQDGDYDTGGAYWGGGDGDHIFHAVAGEIELFRRGKSFSDVEASILEEYPFARFTREEQETAAKILYASFNYIGEIGMTLEHAQAMSHSGQCDQDVAAGEQLPSIAAQLAAIQPADLRKELKEYGSWDTAELADHARNLNRIIWLAAGDIVDNLSEDEEEQE